VFFVLFFLFYEKELTADISAWTSPKAGSSKPLKPYAHLITNIIENIMGLLSLLIKAGRLQFTLVVKQTISSWITGTLESLWSS